MFFDSMFPSSLLVAVAFWFAADGVVFLVDALIIVCFCCFLAAYFVLCFCCSVDLFSIIGC